MTTEHDVGELITQFDLTVDEFLNGNPEPVLQFWSHRQDVTLANPLGPVARGWEQVAATTQRTSAQARDGRLVDVENLTRYVTPELAYLVRIEQAEARLGNQDTVQPFTLRVTMIMRPEDGVWKIVHRHADTITTVRPAESIVKQ